MDTELISLKLFLDKEKNRVLYAESGADFMDVLLSFCTLPIGTVIQLSEKKSEIGCLDGLYKSVEDLDIEYFQTEACKAMLFSPRMENDSRQRCQNLLIRIDHDDEHNNFYFCNNRRFHIGTHLLFSMFNNSNCPCGVKMNRKCVLRKPEDTEVFVKGRSKFMIQDNLTLKPVSTRNCLSVLSQHGIINSKSVEERNILVHREEVLHLLKQSLISESPLKDVFLKKQEGPASLVKPDLSAKVKLEPLEADQANFDVKNSGSRSIRLKLLVSKSKNKVLYAEANEDFVDFMFSFLTFPLGSIFKLLGTSSSIGSFANMYMCVESLCDKDDLLLDQCKELLLAPKVAFRHGIKNQLLNINEAKLWQSQILECPYACNAEGKGNCSHGYGQVFLSVTDPKSVNVVKDSGGGYVKPCIFMVTDNLVVKPFSTVCCISLANEVGVPFSDLEEKEASVGEYEALCLLRASMTSNEVLTEVFCHKKEMGFGMDQLSLSHHL